MTLTVHNAPERPSQPAVAAGAYPYWLIALIEPQHEKRARDWLWESAEIPSYLPVERVTQVRRGRKVDVENLMIRGYLFVPALYANHAQIQRDEVRGIRGQWRYASGALKLVPDAALNPIRTIEANLNDPAWLAGKPRKYRAGQAVRLIDGAWRGLIATVDSLRDGQRIVVDIGGVLGHVELGEEHVTPA
ncbi:hypothetical protein CCR97_08175 [Rhodoplanes elegans]|uniref:NusG-like N-terminal domain-containing protein n=1 Tax=Rhodoplanes elegans TaxID=29408 RepID=A0A327KSS3_9BRAD|nr:transcription termination/antitermination NusG family protein [Rhodoplanes elegans]MBK5958095.1 hypothetical protein [Rhodoplanes elegans]MBK5958187.1 hypothetical protein [Rhodoplanes elegans]RAI41970.1 hypothetical protein CH338_01315 [Rhodoplanes elegans]